VPRRVLLIDSNTKIVRIGQRPLRVTLVLLIQQLGFFLAWAFADGPAWVSFHLAASAQGTIGRFEIWQPLTALAIHVGSRSILFNMLVLWMIGSSLERFWGGGRFLFFWIVTGVVGNAAGTVAGLLQPAQILSGSTGSTAAMLLAFAVVYAGHLVFVWKGVLPLKAQHLGPLLLGFLLLGNLLGKSFLEIAVQAGGAAAALLFLFGKRRRASAPTSKPRATGKLQVIEGGKKKDEPRYWN
jgi:membrane associated rhomboid family serine protease